MSLSFAVNIKGKKVTVKASPATPLLQVLNDACKQVGCESDGYILVYNGKELDKSVPCRLSGLANGAKLDAKIQTTSSTGLVRVGLQLPSTERAQHQFPSNATLSHILHHVGFEYDSSTKVNYLNTEILYDKFESTTLSSLGLTGGSGLLRIIGNNPASSHSPTQTPPSSLPSSPNITASPSSNSTAPTNPSVPSSQNTPSPPASTTLESNLPVSSPPISSPTLSSNSPSPGANISCEVGNQHNDANMEDSAENISDTTLPNSSTATNTPSECNNSNTSHTNTVASYTNNDNITVSNNNVNNNVNTDTSHSSTQPYSTPDRNLQVFLPNESGVTPKYEVPETFYSHTKEDAQELARIEQKRKKEMLDNQVLKTKAMREAERQQKALKFSKTVIRVRFPDRVELQAEFAPQEDVSNLLQFVKENLCDSEPFYLYITPPVKKLEKGTLESLGLCPSAVVLFARENKTTTPPFLKGELKAVPKPSNDPSSTNAQSSSSPPNATKPTTTTTTTATSKSTGPTTEAAKKDMETRLMSKFFGKKK